jgi:hypothetical protein
MPDKRAQILRKDQFDVTHIVPVSALYVESHSEGHLSKLMHDIFSIFSSGDEKDNQVPTNNETMIFQHDLESDIEVNEKQSLNDLEICANAARETEAYGQYEWINTSDE